MNVLTKRILATLLTSLLLVLPFAARAEDDPVVVRVGTAEYRLAEVQQYWNNLALLCVNAGEVISESDLPHYEQSVVESFVSMGVIQNKFAEFGLERQIDPQALAESAAAYYAAAQESYAEQIAAQYGVSKEEAMQHALTFLALNGYTMDTAREQALIDMREKLMLEHVTADIVAVSPAKVRSYYEENYVAPSQAAYQNDIAAFEQDVLYYGGVSYYIPAGYRYVRHILLPASAADVARLQDKQAEIDQADEAIQTLQNRIHGLALLSEDTAPTQAELDAALLARDELTQAYQDIIEEIAAGHSAEVEAIQAALAEGTPFDTLLQAYNQDALMPEEGYMICAESTLWATAFRDGAMAPARPGDVGGPVHTAAGVHFFEYTSDAPAGAVPLTGELEQTMTAEALLQKKYSALAGFVAQWRQEYDVFTDASLLATPPCLQAQ